MLNLKKKIVQKHYLLFIKSLTKFFKSGRFKAKSIVASKKPCLDPISYLLPNIDKEYTSSSTIILFIESVNWISLPNPLFWVSKYLNIVGDKTYLPPIASLEGASLTLGFSTTLSNLTKFPFWPSKGLQIPYLTTSHNGTSKVPKTLQFVCS